MNMKRTVLGVANDFLPLLAGSCKSVVKLLGMFFYVYRLGVLREDESYECE